VAYVLLLDELRTLTLADRQAAVMATAMGATVEIPDWASERARFDQALAAPPVHADAGQTALRLALGLPDKRGR
jgi:hypothetical protein